MRARARRFWLIVIAGAILCSCVALTLYALGNQVSLFYTSADLIAKGGGVVGERARIGGLVKAGTVKTHDDGTLTFVVEDGEGEVNVVFDGFIPDLFKEGQGVVCNGTFTEAYAFKADELLAKHDENYMPKEVEEKLKEQGVYREPEA